MTPPPDCIPVSGPVSMTITPTGDGDWAVLAFSDGDRPLFTERYNLAWRDHYGPWGLTGRLIARLEATGRMPEDHVEFIDTAVRNLAIALNGTAENCGSVATAYAHPTREEREAWLARDTEHSA